jgi:hypothetical protein
MQYNGFSFQHGIRGLEFFSHLPQPPASPSHPHSRHPAAQVQPPPREAHPSLPGWLPSQPPATPLLSPPSAPHHRVSSPAPPRRSIPAGRSPPATRARTRTATKAPSTACRTACSRRRPSSRPWLATLSRPSTRRWLPRSVQTPSVPSLASAAANACRQRAGRCGRPRAALGPLPTDGPQRLALPASGAPRLWWPLAEAQAHPSLPDPATSDAAGHDSASSQRAAPASPAFLRAAAPSRSALPGVRTPTRSTLPGLHARPVRHCPPPSAPSPLRPPPAPSHVQPLLIALATS